MKTAWMIRSGGRGAHMDLFESGIVGIGYDVPTGLSGTQALAEIGVLREGDKSLHLSTNAFTREAHDEAERANVAVKLLDLDALALLFETHYDHFDTEARALLPLTRIYWPAD